MQYLWSYKSAKATKDLTEPRVFQLAVVSEKYDISLRLYTMKEADTAKMSGSKNIKESSNFHLPCQALDSMQYPWSYKSGKTTKDLTEPRFFDYQYFLQTGLRSHF